jgi:hypothetical protein
MSNSTFHVPVNQAGRFTLMAFAIKSKYLSRKQRIAVARAAFRFGGAA